jgi:hypothetical protein
VLVQPDGRFDFVMVPPGKYVLVVKHVDIGAGVGSPSGEALEFLGPRGFAIQQPARRPDAVEPTPLYAAIPVIVANADVMGLSVPLRRGAILKGRVQFVGSAQPPVAQSGRNDLMQFLLESAGFDPTDAASDVVGHVSVDGSFETPPLAPGRYDFRIQNGLPTWPTVKSIVMNGSDVLDLAFDVAASDLSDVVVTFSDVPRATLSGTLSGGAPAPSDDLTLLIFPADHQYWTDPAASARRFRSAVIDAKGTFTVGPLPAGHYFASVVPDEQARDWQDTATLEALTKKAMTIDLSDGDTKAIQVKR